MRVHLEQEDTQEKKKYDEMKAEQIDLNDDAWKIAEKIVVRGIILMKMLKSILSSKQV